VSSVWLYSDPHFYHKGMTVFTNEDGSKLRPWTDHEEMTEDLIRWYNEVVKPEDKVYFLGDVCMRKPEFNKVMPRLMGDKVLIKGNHDTLDLKEYVKYFRDIRSYHIMDRMLLSHIPVSTESKGRFKANIHGHTHSNFVRMNSNTEVDPWYINVCVEQTNWRPILFEEVRKKAGVT
jgi:calcineurin-like phosphoesterase family protein